MEASWFHIYMDVFKCSVKEDFVVVVSRDALIFEGKKTPQTQPNQPAEPLIQIPSPFLFVSLGFF